MPMIADRVWQISRYPRDFLNVYVVEDDPTPFGRHAYGFAWTGYTNDSNSAAKVPGMAPGAFSILKLIDQ
jgi:hypothetical protein